MNMTYEVPTIEILEVTVEKGFSVSLGLSNDPADSRYDIL